jgi:hypothetical protein
MTPRPSQSSNATPQPTLNIIPTTPQQWHALSTSTDHNAICTILALCTSDQPKLLIALIPPFPHSTSHPTPVLFLNQKLLRIAHTPSPYHQHSASSPQLTHHATPTLSTPPGHVIHPHGIHFSPLALITVSPQSLAPPFSPRHDDPTNLTLTISPIQPHSQPLHHLIFRLRLGHLKHPEKPLKPATHNKAKRTATPHAILLSPLTSHHDFANLTTQNTHLDTRHHLDALAAKIMATRLIVVCAVVNTM